MGVILASIVLLFLNKKEGSKVLALCLICYLSTLYIVRCSEILVFEDYLLLYGVTTTLMCVSTVYLTELKVWHKLAALLTVLPQLYYLLVLYKPYVLSTAIPMWFLFNVDSIFVYGVLCIAYEQRAVMDLSELEFKDYILNITILLCLVLF